MCYFDVLPKLEDRLRNRSTAFSCSTVERQPSFLLLCDLSESSGCARSGHLSRSQWPTTVRHLVLQARAFYSCGGLLATSPQQTLFSPCSQKHSPARSEAVLMPVALDLWCTSYLLGLASEPGIRCPSGVEGHGMGTKVQMVRRSSEIVNHRLRV
ncbi:hypothetical protein PV04_05218 [Phialophora macrospora]|uniref:Uncharacterized protein n=1 Tax=Phialophora macrospora TaxID=1851006 RepID=A0A0D2E4Q8_9EURO|nr:hypothetical protein PV04_05218 [Phialophora macrospora]